MALLLAGCDVAWNKAETSHDVVGQYVYKYVSGEVESWIFNDDMTYRESLYANESDLKKNLPSFYNTTGAWHFDGRVTMDEPLMFFDLFDKSNTYASPMKKPIKYSSISGLWYPPSGNYNAGIEIYSSENYILVRINDPNEIDKINLPPVK